MFNGKLYFGRRAIEGTDGKLFIIFWVRGICSKIRTKKLEILRLLFDFISFTNSIVPRSVYGSKMGRYSVGECISSFITDYKAADSSISLHFQSFGSVYFKIGV